MGPEGLHNLQRCREVALHVCGVTYWELNYWTKGTLGIRRVPSDDVTEHGRHAPGTAQSIDGALQWDRCAKAGREDRERAGPTDLQALRPYRIPARPRRQAGAAAARPAAPPGKQRVARADVHAAAVHAAAARPRDAALAGEAGHAGRSEARRHHVPLANVRRARRAAAGT
jgi:hypothetical protein